MHSREFDQNSHKQRQYEWRCALPLSVKHPEADTLAHLLAERTGESLDEAVVKALRERLERTPQRITRTHRRGEVLAIGRECAGLPDYDLRAPDQILGYDEHGVPR
jgi:antitoxin VapB